jgi:hypothetical protein
MRRLYSYTEKSKTEATMTDKSRENNKARGSNIKPIYF